MSLELTERAQAASVAGQISPQIVLEIDGVETLFGALVIKKIIKIGDAEVGEPGIYVGGQFVIQDQQSLISFSAGTSSEISQTLNIDKGTNESVTSMRIALVDIGLRATRLITPGEIVDDILGRKVKVWMGFPETSWREDYIIIFRGIIDSVDAKSGVVLLNISSPDIKKKSALFPQAQTKLTASMNNSQTTANVEATADFLMPYIPASGVNDPSLKFYIRIDDEIIRYEASNATQFQTLTRGALGTTAAAHAVDANVDSFYVMEGNAIDLALKFLLSGTNGPYATDIDVTNFYSVNGDISGPSYIFFKDLVFDQKYNPTVGDFITTTGATNGANNVTNKEILAIGEVDDGFYFEVDGVTFVNESSSPAVLAIRSKYDVWGTNAGLAMAGDEVDIAEHLDIQSKYLASADYRFYIKATIENGKDFLAEQIYNPASSYALPRKAQSSIGIHTGPIPGVNIKTLDITNVTNASKLSLQRSINKNFFNSIIYKFDENVLDEKFKSGTVDIDGTSITQIPVGNKPLIIESHGLRTDLNGVNVAQIAGNRRLRKYKFGAEFMPGVDLLFSDGFNIEVGDKVIVDMASLKIADIRSAGRDGDPRLFEVVNKKLKIATGQVSLDLVDTNFSLDVRYALIGPASKVKTGISQTEFVIDPSYNTSTYGTAEYKKWENFIGAFVKVRNSDFSVSGTSYIDDVNGNTITLTTALGFTPAANYIMEFGDYDNQPANVKLIYGFLSDGANNFGDGMTPYQMS
jgi:hypothetical protein